VVDVINSPTALTAEVESRALHLLDQVIRHRGNREIATGEFRYSLSISEPPPSKEATNDRVEQVRAVLRDRLEKLPESSDLRQRFEHAIATADEYVPEQMHRDVEQTIRFYFALGGPALGGDRYYEFSVLDQQTLREGPATCIAKRSLGASGGVSLVLDGGDGVAIVGDGGVFVGSMEPQQLGRATGVLELISASAEAGVPLSELVEDVRVQRIDDCEEVTCRLADSAGVPTPVGAVRALRLLVDSHRGYVVPFIQEVGVDGRVIREWKSRDYFQPRDCSLWFPAQSDYREFASSDIGPRCESYEFVQDGVALNNTLPEERFGLSIGPQVSIIDSRSGDNKRYVAKLPLLLTLDDVDGLGTLAGLSAFSPAVVVRRDAASAPAQRHALWPLALNGAVIAVLLAIFVFRRRSRRLSCVIVLVTGLLSSLGCRHSFDGSLGDGRQTYLTASPSEINLGEIAIDGSPVAFAFKVENRSNRELSVKVLPSCGCTTVDDAQFELPPFSSHEARLTISARGRSGPFTSQVRVTGSAHDGVAAPNEIEVLVHARFLDYWTARPRRLVLALGSEALYGSILSVSAPADSWEGVCVDVLGSGIKLAEGVAEDSGSLRTRHFRVVGTSRGGTGDQAIMFHRNDPNHPFLTVPVLVR
jgi:hypothetical protein